MRGININSQQSSYQGRGTSLNLPNRFDRIVIDQDPEWELQQRQYQTVYLRDFSKTILSCNDSPDIPFSVSLNPYRGCEHGCVYCYARPTHEYMGLSSGLDFESVIFCKTDAPELLRKELSAKSWTPRTLVMSGVTDCYQPVERKLRITRQCLEVAGAFKNPVAIITKNHLIARDIDLFQQMTRWRGCAVSISLTSLRRDLARVMEPRASQPEDRLEAVRQLSRAGIPVGVMVAPIIPALNDEEIPSLLKAARDAGALWAAYTVVRLPYGVKDLFTDWLTRCFPERKDKILHRIEHVRGGKLNDPRFGSRMSGEGIFAQQIRQLFEAGCKKIGFHPTWPELNAAAFDRPGEKQMELFEPVVDTDRVR